MLTETDALLIAKAAKLSPLFARQTDGIWQVFVDGQITCTQQTLTARLAKHGARLRGYGWTLAEGYNFKFDMEVREDDRLR